jgi:hypothetical protein
VNSGALLIALGTIFAVSAVAGPGCSNSQSRASTTSDSGSTAETGAEAGAEIEAGPPVNEASVCEGTLTLPLAVAACAAANCCTPVTTCFGDSACALMALCDEQCSGDGGTTSACENQCESGAAASSVTELHNALACIQKYCERNDAGSGEAAASDAGAVEAGEENDAGATETGSETGPTDGASGG